MAWRYPAYVRHANALPLCIGGFMRLPHGNKCWWLFVQRHALPGLRAISSQHKLCLAHAAHLRDSAKVLASTLKSIPLLRHWDIALAFLLLTYCLNRPPVHTSDRVHLTSRIGNTVFFSVDVYLTNEVLYPVWTTNFPFVHQSVSTQTVLEFLK